MSAHDKLRLYAPLDKKFLEKRANCEKENAWLRRLKAETEQDRGQIRDKKLQVREARDSANF